MSLSTLAKELSHKLGLMRINRLWRSPAAEIRWLMRELDLRRHFGPIYSSIPVPPAKSRMLVASMMSHSPEIALFEALFLKGIQLGGCEPFILTSKFARFNRLYVDTFGLKSLVYIEELKAAVDAEEAEKIYRESGAEAHLASIAAMLSYRVQDVHLGKYILSTLFRRRHGRVDLADPATLQIAREACREAIFDLLVAHQAMQRVQPDKGLFLEVIYSPFGQLYDSCIARGIEVIRWCGSHDPEATMFQRQTKSNQGEHPASVSRETWERFIAHPLTASEKKAVQDELERSYRTGSWFAEVGTQFSKKSYDREKVIAKLALDPNKKIAVLFSHMFWDATFFGGEDLFRDYREWFVESVKAMGPKTNVNWIVKLHPANVVKLNRDGFRGRLVEMEALEEAFPCGIPSHIKVLPPDDDIDTFSLFPVMDYVLTVRGTIGIEAAMFGIPVLTAGTGRYHDFGFTLNSASKEEYLARLAGIEKISRLTPEQTNRAITYAFILLKAKPFKFHKFRNTHAQDRLATQKIETDYRCAADVLQDADLRRFAAWACESDEADLITR